MRNVVIAAMMVAGAFAFAEEKTCAVKGMHCSSCTESVQGKVCEEGKYTTCDVKITNAKKEMGQIHLITKDTEAKVDETAVSAAVKDAGYTMQKCTTGKGKDAKAAKAKG